MILKQKIKAALPAYIGSLISQYLPVLSAELLTLEEGEKLSKYNQVIGLYRKLCRYLEQINTIRDIITSILESQYVSIDTEVFDVEEGVMGFQNGWFRFSDQTFNPYTYLTLIARRTDYAFDLAIYNQWVENFKNGEHEKSVLWKKLSNIMPRSTHGDELYLMKLVLASACMGLQIQALGFLDWRRW